MAHLSYARKKKILIYLLAAVLLLSLFVFTACNRDNANVNFNDGVNEPTHFMAKFLIVLNDKVGNFGWTVVVFTVILKTILLPFDFWQKHIMRKNAKAMKRMKPRLDELQEKFGNDKQRLQQEQMALYKKEKYSVMGSCLPTLITLVVFIVVFSGFRQMVSYQNALVYKNAVITYTSVYDKEYTDIYQQSYDALTDAEKADPVKVDEIKAVSETAAKDKAQTAVAENYQMPSFLWIHNIFVPDSWEKAIPDYTSFSGQKGFANARIEGVMISDYETVMAKLIGTGGYGKNGKWNGLLILPALTVALSVLSQLLMSKTQGAAQPPAQAGMEASQKMMQWMMPVLMGVFALFYSAAFTLYMFVNSLYSILFQLIYSLATMLIDRKNGEAPVYVKKSRK
ncbi:MAG: YidC/Oxa1 family membrane protein insertase [Clostridiales bacterium]|nr:YidC/Oxa1 family membrane protein insertase [Clostridiales bacterium]